MRLTTDGLQGDCVTGRGDASANRRACSRDNPFANAEPMRQGWCSRRIGSPKALPSESRG